MPCLYLGTIPLIPLPPALPAKRGEQGEMEGGEWGNLAMASTGFRIGYRA